ncbi:hypothetical protein FisN_25Hh224 [Fistulifera solaris]|uniref:PDZ domain-containing protein n=1 Tax=Fistulifera solaris TaxID=1519565 RepID=A0A1Z5K6X5_FISSO|nr:hypothetical protein FisN_25Hh224 [Fistulifera solaris]|eukprot:GAX21976.1 hypothetical protein FisN_25Hh224 [Fistulifera solaris]
MRAKEGDKNSRAVSLCVALSLLNFVSGQFATSSPQTVSITDFPTPTPVTNIPTPTPVSLFPDSSIPPSSLASIGAPTVVAPPISTFPPAMIPPQPIPTESPTLSPTGGETTPPTGPLVDTEGSVYITLFYVSDVIPENYVDAYERQCAVFFNEKLSTLTDPISGVTCSFVEQEIVPNETRLRRRDLQAETTRLLTLMDVKGKISEVAGSPSDINLILRFAVLNDPEGFARTLRESTDTGFYFEQVETVDAFDPATFTPYPTVSPPAGQAEDDDGLEAPGIVAIVIGIVASAILASGITYFIMRRGQSSSVGAAAPTKEKKEDTAPEIVRAQALPLAHVESVPPPAEENPSPTTTDKTTTVEEDLLDTEEKDIPVAAEDDIPVTMNGNISANDDTPTSDDIPTNDDIPANNDIPSNDEIPLNTDSPDEMEEDDDFPVTTSTSVMESEGADALSYAYSLDAGNVDSQTGERVGESTVGGDLSTEVSVRPNMMSREIMAPPGKLGIVIDTTLEGPVVHKVNPGSALEDKIYPGDIIVAIDDVDTRAMSASAITALMVKTANQERRLTVLSEEGTVSSDT